MTERLLSIRPVLLALLLGTVFGGCTVGPTFQRPKVAAPSDFTRADHAQAASRAVESTLTPEWWALLGDPELVGLESRLATDNLDVQAASARLLESRAGLRIAGAEQYPVIGGAASYNREQASPNGIVSLLGVAPGRSTARICEWRHGIRCIEPARHEWIAALQPVAVRFRRVLGAGPVGPCAARRGSSQRRHAGIS